MIIIKTRILKRHLGRQLLAAVLGPPVCTVYLNLLQIIIISLCIYSRTFVKVILPTTIINSSET
jgi:hypothetical protein